MPTTLYIQPPAVVPSFSTKNTTRNYANNMRVAETSYPMYFPTKQVYMFGNQKIVGVGRLTLPMSQDTYGFYSLMVFCTDGIFALGVDRSGDGAYTSITYTSPEVCNYRSTICEIGGAVIFSTKKGLMIITSNDNGVAYVPHLNGKPRFIPSTTPLTKYEGHDIYRKIVTSTDIFSSISSFGVRSFSYAISHNDFVQYVNNSSAVVRYINEKHKLLVYNGSYDYSYLIDIQTGYTTKLPVRICFDDDNAQSYVFWERRLSPPYTYIKYQFEYDSPSTTMQNCLVQSRPIVIQADDKNSFRLVMTGNFIGPDDGWAELVALGSLDAEHWRVIGVKEKKLKHGFHNLGCLTERGTWKYLMFIFAGRLNKGSHIDSIDVTVQGRYNNKKR